MQNDFHNIIKTQQAYTIHETNFKIGKKYQGKVRDVYDLNDQLLIITTDRISAFDRVLTTVPFKGAILNKLSLFWFNQTQSIIPNHVIQTVGENGLLVKKCKILPIEVIIRGYLTGSGWREYQKTGQVSGINLPEGLKKNCKFDTPILTPSTKATEGHDEPISYEEIINQKLVEKSIMEKVKDAAFKLFAYGQEYVAGQNLILVDTKYEFGLLEDGTLILADEIHTSDSSRYWFADSYQENFQAGTDPKSLDKEYLRQYLLSKNFHGDGECPPIPFEIIEGVVQRYLDAYQLITGTSFELNNFDADYLLKQEVGKLNF
ncbi:MAG: phosphoribosylaminoimidazolesuccinocarboxamide synthase [Spirochaetes bacterium]|nr:phosphoribosylaminoimidazolesuccinocarboxamide synthase [Spirochaetota bacterium]